MIGRYRFITFWQRAGQVETRRVTCPVHDVVNNETGSQGCCQVTEGKRNGGRLKGKKKKNKTKCSPSTSGGYFSPGQQEKKKKPTELFQI